MKIHWLMTLFAASTLISCGSDDDTSKDESSTLPDITSVSIKGKVIDGYVAGATIYLDMNFNNTLDNGEPNTVSSESGDWALELNPEQQECMAYVPTIADVPVGAIDEDLGEVTEAYQMTIAPGFEAVDEEQVINISPLTSVVWDYMQSELSAGGSNELTCDIVKANAEKQEQLLSLLESSIEDIVRHYNLSEEQIFADFVANNDSDAYGTAQDIVKGLQKSFIETAELQKQYSEANYVKVRYHKFSSKDADDLYPEDWYKDTYIFADGLSITHLEKVTDDLSTSVRTIIYGERNTYNSEDSTLSLSNSFEYESRDGDDSPYTCDVKEEVKYVSNDVEYELTNLTNANAQSFEDCVVDDFTNVITHRYVGVNYSIDDVEYYTQLTFYKHDNEFGFLDTWVNLVTNKDALIAEELKNIIDVMPYQYDNDTPFENTIPNSWSKSKTYEDNEETVRIQKRNNGEFTKIVTHADGTTTKYCGVNEETWSECPN